MTRDKKINIVRALLAGMPAKFALNLDRYKILFKNKGESVYFAAGETLTEAEREKFFSDSIIFENVSSQYRFNKYGNSELVL